VALFWGLNQEAAQQSIIADSLNSRSEADSLQQISEARIRAQAAEGRIYLEIDHPVSALLKSLLKPLSSP
jgi:hypothetical protein